MSARPDTVTAMTGGQIPEWFKNIIAGRLTQFVHESLANGGTPDHAEFLTYAVHAAREDVDAICMKLLGGTARHNPEDFRNAILGQFYAELSVVAP